MEFSPVSFSSLSNQSVDIIFSVTVTSSLRHAGWTAASGSVGRTAHGCLVLEQKFNPQDNPENIMSKQTQFWLSTIISAGLIPLLFLVGVPGNVLSAAVFYRQGLRERINFCVFSLALVDLVVLVVIFCLSVEKMYRALVGPFNFFIQYFVGLTGFTWVSMFLSVAIAAERCFCVVSPLHAQRVLSTRTLAIVIISVSAIILTGMLTIAGPKHTEMCVFDPQSNTTSLIVYVTEYYKENKPILDIFDIFVYAMTLPVIFFVVIVITTIITAAKLRSASRWRQKSSVAQPTGSLEHHVVAVTRMLIATSVLFVLCLSPVIVVQLSIFLVPELKSGGRYHNFRTILWSSIDLLRCVNSSLNFFVYYRMGSRFRQTLKQMLRLEEDGTVVSRSDLMGASSKKPKQSEQRAVSGNDNVAYVNE